MQQRSGFSRYLLVWACASLAVLAAAFVGPGGRAGGAEAMGIVKGIVVDEAGQPVAGARVVAARLSFYELGDPFAPALDAATDAQGRFQAQLAPGDYRIWAAKGVLTALDVATNVEGRFRTQLALGDYWVWVTNGFLTREGLRMRFPFWTVEASRPLDVRITLRKGRRIEAIVVRKEDGQPVASAKVMPDTGLPAMTDREGRFTIEGAGEEEARVMVSAPGLADTRVWEQLDAWPRPSLRIEMPPGLTLRGRVTDEAGRPIRAARVTTGHTLWGSSSCLTDAAGNYALAGLPQYGEVPIVAYHRDNATEEAGITPSTEKEELALDLKLGQGFAVEGQVRGPDGKPIPDALVGCCFWFPSQDPRENARTDAKGFFRLDHLSDDSERGLTVWAKGHLQDTKKVEPGRGAAVPHLSFDLEKGLQAAGRVTDPQGKPLAGACLVAWIGYPGG